MRQKWSEVLSLLTRMLVLIYAVTNAVNELVLICFIKNYPVWVINNTDGLILLTTH